MAPLREMSGGRFVLEAKTGPNQWVPIDTLYPGGDFNRPFAHEGAARLAKASLKSWLHGKWKGQYQKYPIRVKALANAPDESAVL